MNEWNLKLFPWIAYTPDSLLCDWPVTMKEEYCRCCEFSSYNFKYSVNALTFRRNRHQGYDIKIK